MPAYQKSCVTGKSNYFLALTEEQSRINNELITKRTGSVLATFLSENPDELCNRSRLIYIEKKIKVERTQKIDDEISAQNDEILEKKTQYLNSTHRTSLVHSTMIV